MLRLVASIVVSAFMVSIGGCASTPPSSSPPAAQLPAIIVAFAAQPLWFGTSEHSPFGPIPYALAARMDGLALVLRADVPDGMGLPPGAYQQFTFTADTIGSHLDFETSLTGTVVTGRLIETTRAVNDARYCLPPERGSCAAMEVSFTKVADGIHFVTRRGDAPHHAIVLKAAARK